MIQGLQLHLFILLLPVAPNDWMLDWLPKTTIMAPSQTFRLESWNTECLKFVLQLRLRLQLSMKNIIPHVYLWNGYLIDTF